MVYPCGYNQYGKKMPRRAKKRQLGSPWFRRRLFLTVTFSETGRPWNFRPRLWLVVGVFALLAIGAGALTVRHIIAPAAATVDNLPQITSAYEDQIDELKNQLSFRDKKMDVFAHEVGVLQARLSRFESIGQKLYQDKYFGQYLQDYNAATNVDDGDIAIDSSPLSIFEIASQLATAQRKADDVERVLETGYELLSRAQLSRSVNPHMWPVIYPTTYISSHYGWRKDPFSKKRAWHGGLDIAGAYNAPIVASADGMVTYVGYRFGYGLMVELTHSGGVVTRYAHLKKVLARNGQSTRAGEVIGLMGSSGRSTGPHLHFEVLVGNHKVDPQPFIRDARESAQMLAQSQPEAYSVESVQ